MSALVLFLTMNFEFDQDHGPRPGPELDKHSLKTAQLELDSKVQLYSMTDQNKQLVCHELNKGHRGSSSLTESKIVVDITEQ